MKFLKQLKLDESLKNIKTVYFIGIGGIGMSALARYFASSGVAASGYDKTPSQLTIELEAEGIPVHYKENLTAIPENPDLVVFTPAIPKDHAELLYYQQNGFRVVKRSEVLEMITANSFNICVAGTHGKTTITTMTAHLLRDSGYGGSAFLGGISVNYGTNYWTATEPVTKNNVCVVEADEYDRSFLKLSPDIAVITAMDADHLDIYGDARSMENAFIEFSSRIKAGGRLIKQFGLSRGKELKGDKQWTYSLQNESADVYARNIRMTKGSYVFDAVVSEEEIENISLQVGGMHNVENAMAAIAVARSLNIDNDSIRKAVGSFKGVKRRFEYIINRDDLVFIDDYAHHPEELRALLNGARSLFRDRKCTIIFQPHLYTRTRDLAEGFAEVLGLAHNVILLPVYPAREEPIPGVNSEMILDKMDKDKSKGMILSKQELLHWLENDYKRSINTEFGEVLITAGAGDIDLLVEPIKNLLKKN
jgi:UDP-N-acetylmuramate--alanine ligase